jgi:uncharacterized protein YegJ (DUF2314 family)
MRSRFGIVISSACSVTLLLLCSCSKKPEQSVLPAGSPMADSIQFQYAVYMLPIPAKNPLVMLQKALEKKYAGLKLVTEIPKDPRKMVVRVRLQKHVRQEYAPPSLEDLRYSGDGLSPKQAQALQKSDEAFILEFAHPNENVWTALHAADELVEEIARKAGGLVWDEETREVFTPDVWHEKRLKSWSGSVPDISSQTVIHVYKKDELERAITLGMTKMGLPDVVVDGVSWSSNGQVGHLINLFCQAMAEGAVFEKSGRFNLELQAIKNSKVRDAQLKSLKGNSMGVAYLSLKPGVWEEGDPKNRLIQLTADRYVGNDPPAKQDRMLSCSLGWEDKVTGVEHNEELLEESRRERAKLPRLQKDFNAGLQPGEFILVKAPFKTPDGGNEWMWVEITSWKGSLIRGTLENQPFNVPDLHAGQVVEVWEGDVFDYIRQYPDKRREGNTTGEIIRKMDQKQSGSNPSTESRKQVASQSGTANCTPD